MLQTGRELAVCVLVLLTIGTVTNTSSEATDGSDSVAERYTGQLGCTSPSACAPFTLHTACLMLTRSSPSAPAVNIQGHKH